MIENMVTFGADPDKQSSWEDSAPKARPSRQINDLVHFFIYHPKTKMSHRVESDDRAILGAYFSRKVKTGMTPLSLRSMVDVFYASPFSKTDRPARAFVSNRVQESLVRATELHSTNQYADWVLNGMPDVNFIPDVDDVRKALLRYCDQGLLMYPDVVIDIIRSGVGVSRIAALLAILESLIEWNCGEVDKRPSIEPLLDVVGLPSELRSSRRGNLRPAEASASQAIFKMKGKR